MALSVGGMPSEDGVAPDSPILWRETASFLRVTIWVSWIGATVYCLVHYYQSPDTWFPIALWSPLMVIFAVSWICLAR